MASKKLDCLLKQRSDMLRRQSAAVREIIDNSINPDQVTFYVNEVIFTTTAHRELLSAIDAEIERSRKPWWERLRS